jgi:Zn-dependent peptidase ImmA (M78 family)
VSAKRAAAYQSKKRAELRRIADIVRTKFPSRRKNFAVDIEGIVEDFGIDLLFRTMRGVPVEAYVPHATDFIVINQDYVHHRARYRFTVAEELAHRILEFNLLEPGKGQFADARRTHELTSAEYRAVERDAKCLAAEILQPEEDYRVRFVHHENRFRVQGLTGDALLKAVVRSIAHDFDVSLHSSANRARVLGFVAQRRYDLLFPPLM